MDTLFIGDIPQDFHYAQFANDYITLYNIPTSRNGTFTYYRIYKNYDNFMYSIGQQTWNNNIGQTVFQDVKVSNSWWYRTDIDSIFVSVFLISLLFIFIFNIITSCFKKGGVFGGLL